MTEMSQAEEAFTQADTASHEEAASSEEALYEAAFHVVPNVEESEAATVAARVRDAVEKAGGTVSSEEAPKRMTLAYPIERVVPGKREKYTESYFGYACFSALPEAIPPLQEALREDKEILRFLVTDAVVEDERAPRAVFASDRLEGETIKKPANAPEENRGEVSEEELDKSIEALVS